MLETNMYVMETIVRYYRCIESFREAAMSDREKDILKNLWAIVGLDFNEAETSC